MVEVFKTNVTNQKQADMLVDRIQKTFADYCVNFDLADCDRILRVKRSCGSIESYKLIGILKDFGFYAEILPDEIQTFSHYQNLIASIN